MTHGLRRNGFIMTGRTWQQECEVAGHITSVTQKQADRKWGQVFGIKVPLSEGSTAFQNRTTSWWQHFQIHTSVGVTSHSNQITFPGFVPPYFQYTVAPRIWPYSRAMKVGNGVEEREWKERKGGLSMRTLPSLLILLWFLKMKNNCNHSFHAHQVFFGQLIFNSLWSTPWICFSEKRHKLVCVKSHGFLMKLIPELHL